MLVLTREPSQTIKIGEDIYITVIAVKGRQVRIGIDAPKEINVVRTELLARNNEANRGNK